MSFKSKYDQIFLIRIFLKHFFIFFISQINTCDFSRFCKEKKEVIYWNININVNLNFIKYRMTGWRGRNRGRRNVRARGIQGGGHVNEFHDSQLSWNYAEIINLFRKFIDKIDQQCNCKYIFFLYQHWMNTSVTSGKEKETFRNEIHNDFSDLTLKKSVLNL